MPAIETLYEFFGDDAGPYLFRGVKEDGRWREGDILERRGESIGVVGRVSGEILDFMLAAPPWYGPWLESGIDSGELVYEGSYKDGRRWSGTVVLAKEGLEIARVEEGNFQFDGLFPRALIEHISRGGWIAKNWASGWDGVQKSPEEMKLCQVALSTGGPILEVAAGPGGGRISALLHLEPKAPIIVNDIDFRILALWREYLGTVIPENKAVFAAFDAGSCPIQTNSVACVSSSGGIGNIQGSKGSAMAEALRVLRPGGILVALEMGFCQDTLSSMPEEVRDLWDDNPMSKPDGWRQALAESGFEVVQDTVSGGRQLRPDESDKVARAARYGVTLNVEYHYIVARKPVR